MLPLIRCNAHTPLTIFRKADSPPPPTDPPTVNCRLNITNVRLVSSGAALICVLQASRCLVVFDCAPASVDKGAVQDVSFVLPESLILTVSAGK